MMVPPYARPKKKRQKGNQTLTLMEKKFEAIRNNKVMDEERGETKKHEFYKQASVLYLDSTL